VKGKDLTFEASNKEIFIGLQSLALLSEGERQTMAVDTGKGGNACGWRYEVTKARMRPSPFQMIEHDNTE